MGVADACITDDDIWIASANGTVKTDFSAEEISLIDNRAATAVACKPGLKASFSAGLESVQVFEKGDLVRWEWVTNLTSYAGGVYDGPVRSLAVDDDGTLYVGTETAINIRAPNGTVSRLDYQRGVPMNNTQIVAIEPNTQALLAASPKAFMRRAPSLKESPGEAMPGQWQYYHGPRYLLGDSQVSLVDVTHDNQTVVVTDGGIVILEWQWWTLAQKAAHYEDILDRHIRHGMVSDCSLKEFGNASSCTNGPSDNNGLWTSLLVVAEAYRYALSPSPEQHARVSTLFRGMQLLVNITGIRGLMARSAVSPSEPKPSGGTWHKSNDSAYSGWLWKGDASSDEVVGHLFAYPVVVDVMKGTPEAKAALGLMEDIVSYIVENGFYLIDITGNHTQWGVWAPKFLNHEYDERLLGFVFVIS